MEVSMDRSIYQARWVLAPVFLLWITIASIAAFVA
jgi:hypothetical protein